ncbi:unnamed protein product [Caenorhabditis auriculariae]|uniref:Uncharacterized protein n=1 Tax=Caenorhabditis auriculariae TaxID=2777116 RepID=A0A8S1H266_9PELO|nr:unnamed protein product [Caenorhabditis auriculariae]
MKTRKVQRTHLGHRRFLSRPAPPAMLFGICARQEAAQEEGASRPQSSHNRSTLDVFLHQDPIALAGFRTTKGRMEVVFHARLQRPIERGRCREFALLGEVGEDKGKV